MRSLQNCNLIENLLKKNGKFLVLDYALVYFEYIDDITTTEGESVEVFELKGGMDPETLEEWAISYRQNYCGDDILDLLVKGTGLTKEEYLLTHKFPDKTEGFGPGTRSGDFAELLIAD